MTILTIIKVAPNVYLEIKFLVGGFYFTSIETGTDTSGEFFKGVNLSSQKKNKTSRIIFIRQIFKTKCGNKTNVSYATPRAKRGYKTSLSAIKLDYLFVP